VRRGRVQRRSRSRVAGLFAALLMLARCKHRMIDIPDRVETTVGTSSTDSAMLGADATPIALTSATVVPSEPTTPTRRRWPPVLPLDDRANASGRITLTAGAISAAAVAVWRASFIDAPLSRTWIFWWNPEVLSLHFAPGTAEPGPKAGAELAARAGIIPEELRPRTRFVFNGGFRDVHGRFGVRFEGVNYRAPKPYLATIAFSADGEASFFTWPAVAGESAFGKNSFPTLRQNLTPLVAENRVDPFERGTWGGPPSGNRTHLVRSGLCVRKDGVAGYVYGLDIDAPMLANTMLAAECTYGIHLDMNDGMAGADVIVTSGEARDAKPWSPGFMVQRALREMGHATFPIAARPNPRDFFYLTERPSLQRDAVIATPPSEPSVAPSVWRQRMAE
jgi:hypothetical protein